MQSMTQAEVILVASADEVLVPEAEVIEVPLLLSGWQMSALEWAAHSHGLTTGEMVRQLLRDFLAAADRARQAPPAGVEPV
jgi:hypothetical protein